MIGVEFFYYAWHNYRMPSMPRASAVIAHGTEATTDNMWSKRMGLCSKKTNANDNVVGSCLQNPQYSEQKLILASLIQLLDFS